VIAPRGETIETVGGISRVRQEQNPRPLVHQLSWLAALWLGGVATVAIVAFGWRLWTAPKCRRQDHRRSARVQKTASIAASWRTRRHRSLATAAMLRFDGSMIWQIAIDNCRTAEWECFS
jgi:hypothetical protein